MDVPLRQTRRQRGRPVDSDQIFRADVNPLRCAVRAVRKPWVTIGLRIPAAPKPWVAVSGHQSTHALDPWFSQRAARRLSSGEVM
jgi:hypothetical protein